MKRTHRLNVFTSLTIAVLLFFCGAVQAAVWPQVQITWKEPTTRADGSALARKDIKEYGIYLKPPSATNFIRLTSVPNASKTDYAYMFKPANPSAGEHCFYLTTVDTNGLESVPSTNICVPYAQFQLPSAPGTVRVILKVETEAAP